jgi:hypothetical protein
MVNNSATPNIEVDDPETYEVRVDGEIITCEPASVLPLPSVTSCFDPSLPSGPRRLKSLRSLHKEMYSVSRLGSAENGS